jgi:hypothetical protein
VVQSSCSGRTGTNRFQPFLIRRFVVKYLNKHKPVEHSMGKSPGDRANTPQPATPASEFDGLAGEADKQGPSSHGSRPRQTDE